MQKFSFLVDLVAAVLDVTVEVLVTEVTQNFAHFRSVQIAGSNPETFELEKKSKNKNYTYPVG